MFPCSDNFQIQTSYIVKYHLGCVKNSHALFSKEWITNVLVHHPAGSCIVLTTVVDKIPLVTIHTTVGFVFFGSCGNTGDIFLPIVKVRGQGVCKK